MFLLLCLLMCLAFAAHLSPVDPLEPVPPAGPFAPSPDTGVAPRPCPDCGAPEGDCSTRRPPPAEERDPAPVSQRWSRLAPVALLVLGLLAPGVARADIGGAVTGLVLDKVVTPLVLLAITALGGAFYRLIRDHMAPGKVRDALLILDEAAEHGVAYVAQKILPALRGADGKLSGDAKAQAAAAAQTAAIEWLTANGLATVEKVLGLKTPGAVAEQLAPRIEAKVEESKKVLVAAPSGRPIVAVAPQAGG